MAESGTGFRTPVGALVAVLVVLALMLAPATLVGAPAAAVPETTGRASDAPGSGSGSTGDSQASGTVAQAPSRFARIVVDEMTPSIVTTTSRPVVTVSGRVDNIGDRPISDLSIRLERGDAVDTAAGLRTGLADDDPPVAVAGPFQELADALDPGESMGFRLSLPLSASSGPGGTGLAISQPGVYPVQVNVNGTPDYGNPAQVAGSRTLLPVLSLPPDAARAENYVDPTSEYVTGSPVPGLGPDGSVSANLSSPARMTMLWPLAAPPQLAPGVLGGDTEPVRLINDDMARSLADGGRLHELTRALHEVIGEPPADPGSPPASSDAAAPGPATTSQESGDTSPAAEGPGNESAGNEDAGNEDAGNGSAGGAPSPTPETPTALPGSEKLAQSMCLAIDPDLLVTVRAMTLGYEVSTDPADPTAPTRPGSGRSAAQKWLDDLRWSASRMCVVALPFAQADVSSLSRIGNPGLTASAVRSPADIVDTILGVRSVRGLSVPALGAIDDAGVETLADAEVTAAAVASSSVAPERGRDAAGRYRVGPLTAQTYDAPISAAFAALGTSPKTTPLTPASQRVDLTDESEGSRRQAALGALAYPAIAAPPLPTGNADATPRTPGPVTGRSAFLVPPTYWSATTSDAGALFSTARLLLDAGAATPTPLARIVDELRTSAAQGGDAGDRDAGLPAAEVIDPPGVGPVDRLGSVLTTDTTAAIRQNVDESWQFEGALVRSADVAATPERYISPLREDQLRAIRTPDIRGTAVRTHLRQLQEQRVAAVATTLDRLAGSVTILDPGGRYTLASERSPLLLAVRNDLALPVRARLTTSAPEGLEIGDLGAIEIPARGTRQIQLPTRGDASEAISVDIRLTTVTGVALGEPISLSVHTNAYGKPLFYITIIAAAALVLLTARRLWHRFRGEPDPADADRPEPDELERFLAGSGYQERRRTLQSEDRPPGETPFTDVLDPGAPPGETPRRRADDGFPAGEGPDEDRR